MFYKMHNSHKNLHIKINYYLLCYKQKHKNNFRFWFQFLTVEILLL